MGVTLKVFNSFNTLKVAFLLFLLSASFSVQAQTPAISVVRFNNTANYAVGSGVSVTINPTGIFPVSNVFKLEIVDELGNATMLDKKDEFFIPVMNGLIKTGTSVGTYKLRVSAYDKNTSELFAEAFTESFIIKTGTFGGLPAYVVPPVLGPDFTSCMAGGNYFFGYLCRKATSKTNDTDDQLYYSLSEPDPTYQYEVLLIDQFSSKEAIENPITIKLDITDGYFKIPSDLPVGYYPIQVTKTKNKISSVFTAYFLYHTGLTGIAGTDNENICLDVDVSFLTSNIGNNYPGSRYKVNYGDGSSDVFFTHAEMIETPLLTHKFITTTCSNIPPAIVNNGKYYFETDFYLQNKGMSTSECNDFVNNGNPAPRLVNASKPPDPRFNVSANNCIDKNLVALNLTAEGEFGSDGNGCQGLFNSTWSYKLAGQIKFTDVPDSWVKDPVKHNLEIPKAVLASWGPGCLIIKLTVKNTEGCDKKVVLEQTVYIDVSPIAKFEIKDKDSQIVKQICKGQSVSLINTSNVTVSPCSHPAFTWTITPTTGFIYENSTSESESPKITFTEPGVYAILQTIKTGCDPDSISTNLIVFGDPTVKFDTKPADICKLPKTETIIDFSKEFIPVYSKEPYNIPFAYKWEVSGIGVTTSDYEFVAPTNNASLYPVIRFKSFKNYIITLIAKGICSNSEPAVFTFSRHQQPQITNTKESTNQSICSGNPTNKIELTSTVLENTIFPTTYSWTATATPGITPIPAGGTGGTIPASVFYNENDGSGTVTYTVTPTNNGCDGPGTNFVVSINSKVIVNPITDLVLCNNISFKADTITSNVTGATFAWANDNLSIGLEATGTGDLITFTTTNTEIEPITANIHVIPTASGCDGDFLDFKITINPTPTVESVPVQLKCNADLSDVISFVGKVPGTVFNWTNDNPGIGLAESGTGDIAAFTLTNTGTAPSAAHIKVTPTFTFGGTTCEGIPTTFTLTINPSAQANPLLNVDVCNGTSASPISFTTNNTVGTTTYAWTNSDTSIGLGASGSGDIASFAAKNKTMLPVTATIVAVPTFSNGGKECSGPSQTFTITVNPTGRVNKPDHLDVCNDQTATVIFVTAVTGANTVFDWTNDSPGIGIGESGNGNLSFKAVNASDVPITATFTVTPKVLSGVETCSGTPETFTITVNPTPKTILPADQTICSEGTTVPVTLTSETDGATFSWTALASPGVVVTEKSGETATIPSQKLINTTSLPVNVVYEVTATATTCVGAKFTHTIIVNPKPSVSANVNLPICSGSTFNATPLDGSNGNIIPAGTTYSWGKPLFSPTEVSLDGAYALSDTTEVSQTLTNTGNEIVTVTYSVTPKTINCVGEPFIVEVKVNPVPTVTSIENITSCVEQPIAKIVFAGSEVAGTVYKWTSDIKEIGIAELEGTKEIIAFTTTNTTNIPLVAHITVTPTINGCEGLPKTFTITVYPKPVVTQLDDIATCDKQNVAEIKFESTVTGSTFDWENNTPTAWLAASGSDSIPAFTTENLSDTAIVATITVRSSANGCTGDPMIFKIAVNPTSTVDQPLNVEVCNGSTVETIKFVGAIEHTTYNWVIDTDSIGSLSGGQNEIGSFTAVNKTPDPVIATVTVTPISGNGCAGIFKTFTITVNPSPVVSFSEANQAICSGTSTVPVNLSSSTPGVTFSWTAVLPAGIIGMDLSGTDKILAQTLVNSTNAPIAVTYTAVALYDGVVDCTGNSYEYTITVNPVPSVTTVQTAIICSGAAFNISPVNGSGNIVPANTLYTWSAPAIDILDAITGGSAENSPQPSISQVLTNTTDQIATATYTVTPISDGCTVETFTVKVTVNPVPKVTFTETDQVLCSETTSSPVTIQSTTPGVTFKWTATIPDGITGAATDGNSASIPAQTLTNITTDSLTIIYSATATLSNGASCPGETSEYRITVNPPIVSPAIISDYHGFDISVAGGNDGSIDLTVSGGSGTYTYLWKGPAGFEATTQDISGLLSGVYTLSLNDGKCDAIEITYTLREPEELLIVEEASKHLDVLCNGSSTGTIGIQITRESVSPFDYVLTLQSGGAVANEMNLSDTTYLFTNLAAGVYTLTVTDANENTKTINEIEIKEPSKITTSITQDNVLCSGELTGSATVKAEGGVGGYTYKWNTVPVQTDSTAIGLAAGTYTVTVTDANGCEATQPCTITEPALIVLSIDSQINIGCYGDNTGSATASAIGGTRTLSYSWNTVPVQNKATATGLIANTYQVTVTDENNCSKVQTVILTQPDAPLSSTIAAPKNVSCFGGSDGLATVTAVGGTAPYTYSWNCVPEQTTATATDLPEGTYEVIVTDKNGCESFDSVTISQPNEIVIEITDQLNVYCHGDNTGSATVQASQGTGPFSYNWNTNPVQVVAKAVGLTAGTYIVTVQDANACVMTREITITEPDAILTSISSQTNVECFGLSTGSATVMVSGGTGEFSYLWNTVPAQTDSIATALAAGTYKLTVTDEKGCIRIQQVTITQPDDVVLTVGTEKDITCFEDADGAIAISVKGGTKPYAYNWTKDKVDFATTEDLENLEPGTYEVVVGDANNCQPDTLSFTITQPDLLVVSLTSQTNILCFGDATGAANVSVAGGTKGIDYNYAWTGPDGFVSTDRNLQYLKAGAYTLTVTDDSGCAQTLSVTITQPDELIVSTNVQQVSCYGDNNGSIELTITGGTEPYSTYWSSNGNGALQDDLQPGIYTVTVTDANFCQATVTDTIAEAEFFMKPSFTDVTCFGAKNGSISLNIKGGIYPIRVLWSDNTKAGSVRNNLSAGIYSVTLSDGSGCSFSKVFNILEPLQLVLNPAITNAFECDNPNSGAISLNVQGGKQPYTYDWSNGVRVSELTAIPAGDYLITVTDANGCSMTEKYTVKRQLPLAADLSAIVDFNCATKAVKGIYTADVTGGIPPYELVWSSGTASGTYNQVMETYVGGLVVLNVTDAQGCKTSKSFNLDIPTFGIFYDLTDCNLRGYQFDGATSKDQLYVTYLWDFGDGTSSTLKNPQHNFPVAGGFNVRLTITSTTCTSVYEKMVVVEPLPVVTIDRQAIFCKNESVTVHASGASTYLWSDGSTSDSIVISLAGEYSVRGTTSTGCSDTLTFTATNYDLFNYAIQTDRYEVSVDQPTVHFWTETYSLSQYLWDFGDGEQAEGNDLSHTYKLMKDGYIDVNLKIINPNGCEEFATKRIWMVNSSLPNTFTPNGDGINDIFMKDWHLKVYNRNGALLYDGREGWNGMNNGKSVANDTYFYIVYYSTQDGTKTQPGYVTVIR